MPSPSWIIASNICSVPIYLVFNLLANIPESSNICLLLGLNVISAKYLSTFPSISIIFCFYIFSVIPKFINTFAAIPSFSLISPNNICSLPTTIMT